MRTKRGGVMVLTLAVLTGLVAILAGAAASQRLAFRATANRLESRRARLAAEAGVHYVLASLTEQSKTQTMLDDEWAALGDAGNDRFDVVDASFRIQIVDPSSGLSLNHLTREQMTELEFTDEQIDSLLDWREAGQTPREEGAKDDFYHALEVPYNTKLRRFDTLDELLLVRGFTAQDLLPLSDTEESDPATPLWELLTVDAVAQDLNPSGQSKLNVNSQQANVQALIQRAQLPPVVAAAIVQRRNTTGPFGSMSDVLGVQGVSLALADNILDNLSVTGQSRVEGRINLNTATEEALASFVELTPDLIETIMSRQTTGFASLGEVATLPGMTLATVRRLADRVAINTLTFKVRIVGEAGAAAEAYEAIVSIEGESPRLVRFSKAPQGAIERWGWADEATSELTLVEAA